MQTVNHAVLQFMPPSVPQPNSLTHPLHVFNVKLPCHIGDFPRIHVASFNPLGCVPMHCSKDLPNRVDWHVSGVSMRVRIHPDNDGNVFTRQLTINVAVPITRSTVDQQFRSGRQWVARMLHSPCLGWSIPR